MKNAARHIEFERIIRAAETATNFSVDEQSHLGNCAECSINLRQLKNLFSIAPKEFAESVPQAATANLLNIYRKPSLKSSPTLATRLAGLLIFDDWKPEFALSERLSFQDTRQLLYRAGDYSIDLRVNFADDQYLVSGQIFPEVPFAVVRIRSAEYSVEAALNEYGEFNFPPIKDGLFNLEIAFENETIEIKDISLL